MVGGGVGLSLVEPEENYFVKYEAKRKRLLRRNIWEERIECLPVKKTLYGQMMDELRRRLDREEIRGLEVYLGHSIINPSFL